MTDAPAAPEPGPARAEALCEAADRGCQGLETERGEAKRVGALTAALGVAILIMIVEVLGWWWTGSLVLLSDAGHMLSDAGSIGLALFAAWVARRPAAAARTFGYYRAEILAALANGAALFAMTFWLLAEAWHRLTHPDRGPPLDGKVLLGLGVFTFFANVACAAILHGAQGHAPHHGHGDGHAHGDGHGHAHGHEDLNVHGAYLHVLGDALASLGTAVAGAVIWRTGWLPADAIAAAALSLLILWSAGRLVVRSVDVLLESAPRHLDVTAFEAALARAPGVRGVHDLHVWTITSGFHSMSCHVRVAPGSDPRRVLLDLKALIRDRFGIEHTTIQIEVEEAAAGSTG